MKILKVLCLTLFVHFSNFNIVYAKQISQQYDGLLTFYSQSDFSMSILVVSILIAVLLIYYLLHIFKKIINSGSKDIDEELIDDLPLNMRTLKTVKKKPEDGVNEGSDKFYI